MDRFRRAVAIVVLVGMLAFFVPTVAMLADETLTKVLFTTLAAVGLIAALAWWRIYRRP